MITVADIVDALKGKAVGLDLHHPLVGVASIQAPKPNHVIPYFSDQHYDQLANISKTSVLLSTQAIDRPHIFVSNGPIAMAQLIALFRWTVPPLPTLVHDTAQVHASAHIGDGSVIQAGVVIHPGAVIGNRCFVGEGSQIFSNVSIGDSVRIGNNCIIRSGAVIGSDGFGYMTQPDRTHRFMPHQGGVWLGDSVHIGSLTTVDRGVLADTQIGAGTKIDAHCHIAHNALIGKQCLIAGGVQFAGSVTIGDHCIFAGQVAVKDHVTIGSNSVILSRAGVTKSFPSGGVTLFGFPAQLHRDELRFQAKLKRMVDTK
ncbi:UDP-3-O-(3-hydroxymyristoyl)glucosamine N-acyltransferase [Candidatus Marinamargulisbacteria bacterium]|nr:UDP-3-O-(3-hydroxymyristoyl)glucosamine N-acyltransferase [Candidatus Marinamargulisbacteria bacterium]